jgi:hypothetical protein
MIKKSKIIKSFSLKKGSKIGDYIRKISNNKNYNNNPINMQFQEDKLSL